MADVARRVRDLLQSEVEVKLTDLLLAFSFIKIPDGSGSTATVSRDQLSILNKMSVNKVVNDDNNCFLVCFNNACVFKSCYD